MHLVLAERRLLEIVPRKVVRVVQLAALQPTVSK